MTPKRTKLEKIRELQSSNNELEEQNHYLRIQLMAFKRNKQNAPYIVEQDDSPSTNYERELRTSIQAFTQTTLLGEEGRSISSHEERLQETIQALTRVAANQETDLNDLKVKASERTDTIIKQESTILILERDLRVTTAQIKANEDDDLQTQIKDAKLHNRLIESRNEIISCQLEISEQKNDNLQREIESLKKGVFNAPTISDSISSQSDSVRLKEELDKKIETIVLLELDLEVCMEELSDLRGEPKEDDYRHRLETQSDIITDYGNFSGDNSDNNSSKDHERHIMAGGH